MNYLTDYTKFAIITICLLALSATVFGDVKIKSKQTMSGQTYENTTYIKGKRQRTETMSGMMINLTQCDLRRGVQINPNTKTYMINAFNQAVENQNVSATQTDGVVRAGGTVTTTITTKDTGERKQMFGFPAKHLIITMETVSSANACAVSNTKMEFDGWYIDAEFALDCDQNVNYQNYKSTKKSGCQDKFQIKQIGTAKRGYPVYEKMTMFDQSGKESFSTVSEVVELSKATLNADLFEVPSDYREVADASAMYSSTMSNSTNMSSNSNGMNTSTPNNSGISRNVENMAQNASNAASSDVGAKKAGVIRIGMANVKTGAVGEGLSAADLAAAIQNSLAEYLKTPGVELVRIEAKLPSAITAEAKEKECDYIIFANVSHKKGGGGGFGGVFGKVIAPAIGQTGIGQTGSTVGNVAGQVATRSIVTAGSMSANVKSKDQITLDINLQIVSGAAALTKKYNGKAKSDGEDIITPLIEQAAQAIVDAVFSKH